tara:strand:- start:427 stop:693 length:267 start_codon:yes stop_codon:yes gene_type:complete
MCWPWQRKKEKFIKLNEDSSETMKKVRLNDECAVCLAGIIVLEAICCSGCNKIMHKKCLKRWENTCKEKNLPFSCPLCRTELEAMKND